MTPIDRLLLFFFLGGVGPFSNPHRLVGGGGCGRVGIHIMIVDLRSFFFITFGSIVEGHRGELAPVRGRAEDVEARSQRVGRVRVPEKLVEVAPGQSRTWVGGGSARKGAASVHAAEAGVRYSVRPSKTHALPR